MAKVIVCAVKIVNIFELQCEHALSKTNKTKILSYMSIPTVNISHRVGHLCHSFLMCINKHLVSATYKGVHAMESKA